MLKNSIAIIVGLIAAGIVIMLVEMFGHVIYPPPAEFDPADSDSIKMLIELAPAGALMMVVLAYVLGSLVGGAVAALIKGKNKLYRAMIVGIILMIAGIFNLASNPHPVWFWVLCLLIFVPFAYLGGRLVVKRSL